MDYKNINLESGGTLRGTLNSLDVINGYSAYEVALINGFKGTEEEWLATLKGEQGEQGVSGVYVGSGDMPEGYNVQIDPDGEASAYSTQVKSGLTVAIIGDSISTHPKKNACEMVIEAADVGVTLSSYITTYDKGKTISKDGKTSGYTIADADVGKELTFIPCADDVGKKLGTPKNYNSITSVWWQVAADTLGFEPIAAAWSGSSITSHTAAESGKECSYAWHDHTIRKLGKRIPGSMNRVAPDVVLIYRGTNDLSHSTKVRLTSGYFNTVDWKYPTTDVLSGGTSYGYKEGLALTIEKIRTTYPRARIVLCTCNVFKRSKYSHFPTHNGVFSIPQMNNAIREVADFFGCHVIELDKCGITWENCYDEGYITDSSTKPTHPNKSGHALMAQQAISDLVNRLHICDIEPSFDEVVFEVGTGGDEPGGGDTPEVDTKVDLTESATLVEGYYVNKNTGAMVASSLYFSYTGIAVVANGTYSAPYARNYAFYDADGNRVGGGAGEGADNVVITAPAGAATMTVCYKYANFDFPEDVVIYAVSENEPEQDNTDNLATAGELVEGYYVRDNTGALVESSSYFTYKNVPVEPNKTYNIPYARNYCSFKADGTRLSGSGGNGGGSTSTQVTTLEGAVTLTVCYKYSQLQPSAVVITVADE